MIFVILLTLPISKVQPWQRLIKKKLERQKQALMRWIKNNFDLKTRDTANMISQISQLHTYGLSIQEACSLLGIHRSTYYRKLKQEKSSDS